MKKINFRNVNGFAKLVRGESSKFSFFDDEAGESCDASCNVACSKIQKPTSSPPRPFVQKKDTAAGPTYLPPIISKKDEGIFAPRPTEKQTARLTTQKFYQTPSTTTLRPKATQKSIVTQKTTQRQSTQTERPATTTQRLVTSTNRQVTLTQKQYYSTLRQNTPTQRQQLSTSSKLITAKTTTQQSIQTRPRLSTKGPAYLPVSKKSTPKGPTVTERSYPPATWPSTTRLYTQTFPTWSAPIRRSTASQTVPTTAPKYLYKEPSNSLTYAE